MGEHHLNDRTDLHIFMNTNMNKEIRRNSVLYPFVKLFMQSVTTFSQSMIILTPHHAALATNYLEGKEIQRMEVARIFSDFKTDKICVGFTRTLTCITTVPT